MKWWRSAVYNVSHLLSQGGTELDSLYQHHFPMWKGGIPTSCVCINSLLSLLPARNYYENILPCNIWWNINSIYGYYYHCSLHVKHPYAWCAVLHGNDRCYYAPCKVHYIQRPKDLCRFSSKTLFKILILMALQNLIRTNSIILDSYRMAPWIELKLINDLSA